MKRVLFILLLLCPLCCNAQGKVTPDSTMIVRISEIEVYPECLPLIFNKANK